MQSDLFLRNRCLVQPQPRLRLPVQHLRTLSIRVLGDRWLIFILIAFETIVVILFGARIPLIPCVRPIGRKGPEGVLIREFDHAKLLLGHRFQDLLIFGGDGSQREGLDESED
jgi:hypothetical protein